MALQRLFDLKEAAEFARMTTRQLQKWIKQGRFPKPSRSGKTLRWFENDLLEWEWKYKFGLIPPPPEKPKGGSGK